MHAKLAIDTEALPPNIQILAQGAETGAIHEVMVDNRYIISAYDSALQPENVRRHREMVTPQSMAAVTLRAAGVEWLDIQDILDVDETEERIGPLDGRLNLPRQAAHIIGSNFQIGMLRARMAESEEEEIDVFFKNSELRALSILAQGKFISRSGPTQRALDELIEKYPQESLPTLITKAMARELLFSRRRSSVIHLGDLLLPKTAGIAGLDTAEKKIVKQDRISLRHQKYADPELLRQRKEFINYLLKGGISRRSQVKPLKVTSRDTNFTFNFPNLKREQRLALSLHILGLEDHEIVDFLPQVSTEPKRLLQYAKKNLGIPTDVDTTLWCIDEGHVTFDRATKPGTADLPIENSRLLYRSIVGRAPTAMLGDQGEEYWRTALRYSYRALGATNRREATLFAATHRILDLEARPQFKFISGQPTEQAQHEAQEHVFEKNVAKQLEIEPERTEFTIEWRGAKITFDFRDNIQGHEAAVIIMRSFGVGQEHILKVLPRDRTLLSVNHALRQKFGLTNPSAQMLELFGQDYVREIDVSNYNPVKIDLSPKEKSIIDLMHAVTPKEARAMLGMSEDAYEYALERLYEKYNVSDYRRLFWITALSSQKALIEDESSSR